MQDEQQQQHEDAFQNEAFSLVLVTVLQGHTSDEIRLSRLLPFQGLPTLGHAARELETCQNFRRIWREPGTWVCLSC